jgi:transposase
MHDAHESPPDHLGTEETIRQLTQLIEQRDRVIQEQGETIAELRRMIRHLMHGRRSERRVLSQDRQALLPFEDNEEFQAAREEAQAEAEKIVETYTVTRKARQAKPRDESFPAHLRRVERVVEASEEEKTCATHGPRKQIGYDEVETLHRVPAELYVEVVKYPKFVCDGEAKCGVVSPERPTGLVEGNRYDTSVAAAVIEAKWSHYMPIYRQQDIFAGSGWIPSRSTLQNLVSNSVFVITPFMDHMRRRAQGDTAVGIDETSCRMLLPREDPPVIPGDLKNQRLREKIQETRDKGEDSLLAKMWVYSGLDSAPYNIFDFRVSRHRDGPDEFFASSRCKVQGDCFSGNLSVVIQSDERLEFVACWSHARRKVVDAVTYKAEAETLLGMIQALYDIETRGKELSWQDREALRQRESIPVLDTIRKWLDSLAMREILPKSDFAEAVRYINNHWEALTVYARDGHIPIDNNQVEQLMKQVALGRKAWLFVSSVASGEQSAMLMSLVSSAKRHDLDVFVYVKDVLDQLLAGCTDYERLLPDVWKQAHPEAIRVYRQEERRDRAERKQFRAARRRLAEKIGK